MWSVRDLKWLTFEIMSPVFETLDNREHLLVVRVIIVFCSDQLSRIGVNGFSLGRLVAFYSAEALSDGGDDRESETHRGHTPPLHDESHT